MYSADIVQMIVNALRTVVWYKRDFYRILDTSGVPKEVLERAWNDSGGSDAPKVYVADSVVRQLNSMGDEGLGPLRRIIQQLTNWRDFSSAADETEARSLVARLREVVSEHDQETRDRQAQREAERQRQQEQQAQRAHKSSRLRELRQRFLDLMSSTQPQKRGYALERILYDLFEVCGLQPGSAFKTVGEQIDGDFVLAGDDFLLEAQWQKGRPSAEDLYGFEGKVARKFRGTRGLFVSVEGFSPTSLQAFGTGAQANMLLMDGEDLLYVLEERIDLVALLLGKRRHAARTGEVYHKVRAVLGED